MSLTKPQEQFCYEITRKIYDHPLSMLFLEPVNTSIFTDYLGIVKQPMDLGTILTKLDRKEYRDITQWKSDIMQIWKNAKVYNPPDTYAFKIAEIMEQKSERLMQEMPKDEIDLWQIRMTRAAKKLQKYLSNIPAIPQVNHQKPAVSGPPKQHIKR